MDNDAIESCAVPARQRKEIWIFVNESAMPLVNAIRKKKRRPKEEWREGRYDCMGSCYMVKLRKRKEACVCACTRPASEPDA